MKIKGYLNFILFFAFISFFSTSSLAQKPRKNRSTGEKKFQINAVNKDEMVKFVLTDFLLKVKNKKIVSNKIDGCIFKAVDEKKAINISTRNTNQNLIQNFDEYSFTFMTDDEILSQTELGKPVCYLSISNVNQVDNRIWVVVGRYFKRTNYIYGNDFYYEFKKVKSKWRGKYVEMKTFES